MNIFTFIKSNVAILDVIQEYATLKRAGGYWKGNCPFHHERTASFTVTPHREIFYCFGCHAGGDVIEFITKIENITSLEAARFLADRFSLDLPKEIHFESSANHQGKDRHYAICSLVATWCYEQAQTSQVAQAYLKERAISKDSQRQFMIGYFPQGQSAIKSLLVYAKKQSFLAQDLIDAHVLFEGKRELYSPFEERILFPITDHLGRACGFGGRIFQPHDQRPKYYNSSDHLFFSKGTILFGMHQAKHAIQQEEELFLVEGYTDCIAMVQAGMTNTVATLGTACTIEHLKQIARYAQRIILLYDGDTAGQNAIIRVAPLCWQVDLDVAVISLPDGNDPASFLIHKPTKTELLHYCQDLFSFFITKHTAAFASKGMQAQLAAVKQVVDLIKHVENPLKQEILLKKAADAFGLSIDAIKASFQPKNAAPVDQNLPPPPIKKRSPTKEISLVERKLIAVALYAHKSLHDDEVFLLTSLLPEALARLVQTIQTYKKQHAEASPTDFFSTLTQQQQHSINNLLLDIDEQEASKNLPTLLKELHKKQWKTTVNNVTMKLNDAQQRGDTETLTVILSDYKKLQQMLLQKGLL